MHTMLRLAKITFLKVWPILSQAFDYRLHCIHLNWWIIFTKFWTNWGTLWRPNAMNCPRISLLGQIACIFIIRCHPIYANGDGPWLCKCQIIKIIFVIAIASYCSTGSTVRKEERKEEKNAHKNDNKWQIEFNCVWVFTH